MNHSASEKSEWISEDERPYATLIYQAGKGSRVSGGIATLADIDFDKSGGEYTVIIGELASKSELKE
jgi:hypothetical protein